MYMIRIFAKYVVRAAGLALIVIFAASLIWCPDVACRSEDGDDQCTSLICALLAQKAKATSQGPSDDTPAGCACVCHILTTPGLVVNTECALRVQNVSVESPVFIPASPIRSIDRPPKA